MVLAFFSPGKNDQRITLPRTFLRPPARGDWAAWTQLRAESRDFLQPWEPTWPSDVLSKGSFRRRLTRYNEDWEQDRGYSFFIFRRDDDELLGGITLSNVRRGVSQSCSFGYWIGRPHIRQGYMSEAIYGATCFAFDKLAMHRIEAACLPNNAASPAVLRRAGFSHEGLARKYLRINGQWADHLVFALLREDFYPRGEQP